jgi:hypothetical protein
MLCVTVDAFYNNALLIDEVKVGSAHSLKLPFEPAAAQVNREKYMISFDVLLSLRRSFFTVNAGNRL